MSENIKSNKSIVTRDAWICTYCEGVYADVPVTQCDCFGHIDQNPPHFIKGEIKYPSLDKHKN
jgi:hypothetical protein